MIPKGKSYFKYIKSKTKQPNKELIDKLTSYFKLGSSEIITYIEKMFPPSKSMDTCSIYKNVLDRLRSRRNITPNEYVYYKQEINKFCDSRDNLVNKDIYVLYKDIDGKLVETSKKVVGDYNKKDTKVLTVINTNNQAQYY